MSEVRLKSGLMPLLAAIPYNTYIILTYTFVVPAFSGHGGNIKAEVTLLMSIPQGKIRHSAYVCSCTRIQFISWMTTIALRKAH